MLSNKPMWIRFTVPIVAFAVILLIEDGLINLFPTASLLYYTLFVTALGGAFIMSTFLPHPRQEQKRLEALLLRQAEQDKIEAGYKETLAEKRP